MKDGTAMVLLDTSQTREPKYKKNSTVQYSVEGIFSSGGEYSGGQAKGILGLSHGRRRKLTWISAPLISVGIHIVAHMHARAHTCTHSHSLGHGGFNTSSQEPEAGGYL